MPPITNARDIRRLIWTMLSVGKAGRSICGRNKTVPKLAQTRKKHVSVVNNAGIEKALANCRRADFLLLQILLLKRALQPVALIGGEPFRVLDVVGQQKRDGGSDQ
jgi:hypothetical protein